MSGSVDVVSYVGFNNYLRLLHDNFFWQSLGNSLWLWIFIVPAQTIFAILVASLLSSPRLKLRWFFRTVFLTPFVVPLVAVAMVWQVLFDLNSGAVNQILTFLHLTPIGWLTTTIWSKPTIAILVLWKSSGFAILIFLAAIQNIPLEYYEAAGLDGANKFQIFVKITLPLLKRSVTFFLVTSTLGVIQMFVEPSVLTAGGPENSTMTAGLRLMGYLNTADYGMGAANSFLLMIIVIIVALIMIRMMTGSAEG
jgi:ABC-type sugar transport system permease subunit